jgi:hypothetical protein
VNQIRIYENTLESFSHQIRQKMVPYEHLLARVYKLEKHLELIPSVSCSNSWSGRVRSLSDLAVPPSPGSESSLQSPLSPHITKAFSFSQIKALSGLVQTLRDHPKEFALILTKASEEFYEDTCSTWSISIKEMDELARCIVFEIFGADSQERNLIEFILYVIEEVNLGIKSGRQRCLSQTSVPNTLLRANSLSALLVKHALDRFGFDYLEYTIKYLV